MIVKKAVVADTKFSIAKNGARLHWLQVIHPIAGEDLYLHLFDKKNRAGTVSDYGATETGTVKVLVDKTTGMGHGLSSVTAGAQLSVEVLSTNHSGAKTVTIIDEFSFYFTDTYVADDAIIFWETAITLGTTDSKLTVKIHGADADAYKGDFQGVLDALFGEGIVGAITTTLDGSAGVPTNRGADSFTGSGLDDLTGSGEWTGVGLKTYRIQIDGEGTPDTFKWSNDGGTTWEATTVDITGSAQTLENGLAVTFGATTGHTSGDYWDIVVSNPHVTCILEGR